MKKALFVLVALFVMTQLSFAGQPKFVKSWIEPESVGSGKTVTATVEFTGSHKDLKEVYLTVREYPYDYPNIYLKPVEGEKNQWFIEETIPYDAPAQTLHLDINAFDKKGKEIITKGFEKNGTGKAGTIELKIKY